MHQRMLETSFAGASQCQIHVVVLGRRCGCQKAVVLMCNRPTLTATTAIGSNVLGADWVCQLLEHVVSVEKVQAPYSRASASAAAEGLTWCHHAWLVGQPRRVESANALPEMRPGTGTAPHAMEQLHTGLTSVYG